MILYDALVLLRFEHCTIFVIDDGDVIDKQYQPTKNLDELGQTYLRICSTRWLCADVIKVNAMGFRYVNIYVREPSPRSDAKIYDKMSLLRRYKIKRQMRSYSDIDPDDSRSRERRSK